MIAEGRAQEWNGPHSIVVTTIEQMPQQKVLWVFLAAGVQDELIAMHEVLERWAVEQGCTKARFIGRKGWSRTLVSAGWHITDDIVMERALNGTGVVGRQSANTDHHTVGSDGP